MIKSKDDLDQVIQNVHTYNVNHDTREIYLHGFHKSEDDLEPGIDWRISTQFVKNLRVLDCYSHEPVLVHLHSMGGCWDNGMAIFNAIQTAVSPVYILAYAQAYSMSSVILQSPKIRVLMPDCYVMIHHGSITFDATSQAAKQAVDINEKVCKQMLKIFAERALKGRFFKGKNVEYIEKFLDKKIQEKHDWYLNAEEAVEYGFADGILGDRKFKTVDSILKKGKKNDRS